MDELDAELRELYPLELFEDAYDLNVRRGPTRRGKPAPKQRREDHDWETAPIRELNAAGSYIVKRWLSGIKWDELVKEVGTEGFGAGDIMNVLFRVATFLQSLGQTGIPGVSNLALSLRSEILRDPLSLNL
jgi:hypothetical protein